MSNFQGFLKVATAVNITVLMIDSADHITGRTNLAGGLTIYATKAAGTPAAITPAVTELDTVNVKGVYQLALTSAHTDTLGELQLHLTSGSSDPSDYKWTVATSLPGEAASLTTAEENAIADAVLARNVAGGSSGGRIVSDALRFLRNKWSISGATLTVYQEDDATIAWQATLVGTGGTNPVTTIDPA